MSNTISKEKRYEIFRIVNHERARAFDKLSKELSFNKARALRKVLGSEDYDELVKKINRDFYRIKVEGFKSINKRLLPAVVYKF